jgi:hypothetical protein
MGIGSWLKRFRAQEDEEAIERAAERQGELSDERHRSEGGIDGLRADERAARDAHVGTIEDVERLGDSD